MMLTLKSQSSYSVTLLGQQWAGIRQLLGKVPHDDVRGLIDDIERQFAEQIAQEPPA